MAAAFDGALAILETLSPLRTAAFVFPSPRGARPLSHVAMAKVLTRLGAECVTVHGFRSAFRDWAGNCVSFGSHHAAHASISARRFSSASLRR